MGDVAAWCESKWKCRGAEQDIPRAEMLKSSLNMRQSRSFISPRGFSVQCLSSIPDLAALRLSIASARLSLSSPVILLTPDPAVSSMPARWPLPNMIWAPCLLLPTATGESSAKVSSWASQSKTNFLSFIFLILRFFLSAPRYRERIAVKSCSDMGGTKGSGEGLAGSRGRGGGGMEEGAWSFEAVDFDLSARGPVGTFFLRVVWRRSSGGGGGAGLPRLSRSRLE